MEQVFGARPWQKSIGIRTPLLRDVDALHVNAFGIPDEDLGQGIPRPSIFWLAPDGSISAKFAVPGYRTRPPIAEVLASISAKVGS